LARRAQISAVFCSTACETKSFFSASGRQDLYSCALEQQQARIIPAKMDTFFMMLSFSQS
jgi:hypothetical protein